MRVPMMSEGTRSGVNWMRWKLPPTATASVSAASVLATPGTPSSRQCPPASSAVSSRSMSRSCPTITFLTSNSVCSSSRASVSDAMSVMGPLLGNGAGGGRRGPGGYAGRPPLVSMTPSGAESEAKERAGLLSRDTGDGAGGSRPPLQGGCVSAQPAPVAETGYPWPIETARLDNGLRVVVSEDHTAPVVCVNLWYDV